MTNSDSVGLMHDLLHVTPQGVAEIPDEVWDLELADIAAYLGLVAANPGKLYLAAPPPDVWKHLVHYLTIAGAAYPFYGHVEECLYRAREAVEGSAELIDALGSRFEVLYEEACVSWPLPNLTLLEQTC